MTEISAIEGEIQFKVGDTAEDWANKVADQMEAGKNVIKMVCEDPTFPDAIIFQAGYMIDGHTYPYSQVFAMALEELRGIEGGGGWRSERTPGKTVGEPYSMTAIFYPGGIKDEDPRL